MRSLLFSVVALPLLAGSVASAQEADGLHAVDEVVLHGGEPAPSEQRGVSVGCSADAHRVIVGSARSGARIFVHSGPDWIMEHELLPTTARELLGASVALSGDGNYALVGAPNAERMGAVVVLVRGETGWRTQAELRAIDAATGDRFGASVAIAADGSRALIGAPEDDAVADDAGTARVFDRVGQFWTETATLESPFGAYRDELGTSVALSADGLVAITGAPFDDIDAEEDAGSAHLFVFEGTGFSHITRLSPPDLLRRDHFGASVALSSDGQRVLVGAPLDDVDGTEDAGSARVYSFADRTWRVEATLTGIPGEMGASVALSADGATALVGAPRAGGGAGAARVLARTSAGWIVQTPLWARRPSQLELFGTSAALASDGLGAILGAPGDDIDGNRRTGSARTIELAPGIDPHPTRAIALAEVFDFTLGSSIHRQDEEEPSARTPEQEASIRTTGIGGLVGGGIALAGGLGMLLAAGLGSLGCTGSCDGGFALVVIGGVFAVAGVISLIVGGAIFSQRTQGRRRRPRLAIAPTDAGAYVELSLDF